MTDSTAAYALAATSHQESLMLRSSVLCCLVIASAIEAAAFDAVIDIPPARSVAGIQSNTQVNVLDGAELSRLTIPSGLSNVEVNVHGGRIDGGVDARHADRLLISGGTIGSGSTLGRSVLVTGGALNSLYGTGELRVEGGSIKSVIAQGGETDVNGGSIDLLRARNGGTTVLSGGRVGQMDVRSSAGSTTIRGGVFRLNGQYVTGPITLGSNSSERDFLFTGVLEDGSSFVYSSYDLNPFSDLLVNVQLSEVTVPSAAPVIDLMADAVPYGLRAGQTLHAYAGDSLGDNFHANGATLHLGAGSLGERTKLLDSQLVVEGGSDGKYLMLLPGGRVDLRDGAVSNFRAAPTSVFQMSSGQLATSSRGSLWERPLN